MVQTPFDDHLDVDFVELEGEIDWLFAHGAAGIVIGMVSEILRLSTTERDTLAGAVCSAVADRGPVVVGVTAESTQVAIHHARVAEAAGASAVMCTLPLAGAVLPDQALRHFEAIADAVALPVVIQDAGGYLGHELAIETMAHMEMALSGHVGFKPETPPLGQRITDLRAATDGRARIFEGSGGIGLVDAFHRGVVGTMPAADVCWAVATLWAALEAGDEQLVGAIRGPLTSLIALQGTLDSFVAIEKHLLVAQGVISSARVRGPSGFHLDRETADEAERLMAALQLVAAGRPGSGAVGAQ